MNDNYTCSIDRNKLSNSINILVSINNIINSNDVFDYIQDIETYINEINFEHGNCIDNYKEDLNLLYLKADEIKKDLASLIDSLTFSVEKVNSTGTINSSSLKELIGFYKDTSAGEKISKMLSESSNSIGNVAMRKIMEIQDPTVGSTGGYNTYQDQSDITIIPPVEQHEQTTTQPYSTVPIGLGIAATGISAAAGTVLVDSMYDGNNNQSKKFVIDKYKESNDEDEYDESLDNDSYEEETIKADPYPKKVEEYIPPYHASRVQPKDNIFYDYEEEK